MTTVGKPLWQQVTALVSLSAGGTITGLSFVPGTAADLGSPSSLPIRLAALERLAQPAQAPQRSAPAGDAMLRSAIVNVAKYYLQLAQDKSPAEMEALIWQHDSLDGADHGQSCAAFASLTLELGAQVVGQQSWVTGGTSYPWPLHKWADVRVDPNPDSLGIISIQQDAQAHQRWNPLGDGYQPQPGDWVLFDGHVEVVTSDSGGVLHTIGGDSLPNYSVNAHEYAGPLAGHGVAGFVNNGNLPGGTGGPPGSTEPGRAGDAPASKSSGPEADGKAGSAAIPGADAPGSGPAPAAPGAAASAPGRRPAAPASGGAHPAPVSGGEQAAQGSGSGPAAPAPGSGPAASASGDGSAGNEPGPGGRAGVAAIPGTSDPAPAPGPGAHSHGHQPPGPASTPARDHPQPAPKPAAPAAAPDPGGDVAAIPGVPAGPPGSPAAPSGPSAPIPGVPAAAQPPGQQTPPASQGASPSGPPSPAHRGDGQQPPQTAAPAGETSAQQAFINAVAPGAMATQRTYGVPAAVTIAQAVLESGWGQSYLASKDHNLFGIKGQGPAGSDGLPTQEFVNGQWVNGIALFRVYHNFTESIEDHGRLLATSSYYKRAMADEHDPDAFANALTGVYATDPDYGAKLVSLMKEFDLYRYDAAASTAPAPAASASATPTPTSRAHASPTASPRARSSRKPASGTPGPRTPSARTPAAGTSASRTAAARTATTRARPAAASPAPAPAAAAYRPAVASAVYRPAASAAFRPAASAAFRTSAARAAYRPAMSSAVYLQAEAGSPARTRVPAAMRTTAAGTRRRPAPPAAHHRVAVTYPHQIPLSVRNSFIALAKVPLTRAEDLYRDVASLVGIPWELLAACDWMQCAARPRCSPVHGEKLGTANPDGTVYHTKSEALEQCAFDLAELALAVYQIDLTADDDLSVRDLANVFAAFRWGGLLRRHHTSAMEFPYSVAGLTEQHVNMRWPSIDEPNTPDKPGAKFRLPFGAVPIVIGLNYPATAA